MALAPAHLKAAASLADVLHARTPGPHPDTMGWSTADVGRTPRLPKSRISRFSPQADPGA
ncbi:hypothetical protein GT755_35475 [Herbidospora sp. NEAU-GS84]|uniref:Uncharacterized protein n=1 Tax=Herbidospora solisilvae TaxID=2696284 RepID=A0A7C9NMF2_9ACTN|nr:hypothetical protein [Herbidospora solisilvae]NAS26958.1 hypothetical protein [Herbidospora solisilvae]